MMLYSKELELLNKAISIFIKYVVINGYDKPLCDCALTEDATEEAKEAFEYYKKNAKKAWENVMM